MADVINYLRYSKQEADNESNSIQSQDEYTKKKALERGDTVIKTFSDQASGKDFKRPGWIEMMAWLKLHPEIKTIYVKMGTRVSRHFGYWSLELEKLNKLHVKIYSCHETQYLDDSSHADFIIILAHMQYKMITESIKIGVHQHMSSGRTLPNASFGYTKEVEKDYNGRAIWSKYIPVHDNLFIVRQMFDVYKKTNNKYQVWKHMIANGYNMSQSFVKKLLVNPVYAGYIKITQDGMIVYKKVINDPVLSEDEVVKLFPEILNIGGETIQ